MKWFTTIIAMYLIVLSCLPCADMEASSDGHSPTQISRHNDKDSHKESSDMCSPFCICNCCGVQFLSFQAPAAYDFPVASAIIKASLPSYTPVFTSNFFGSIWQPPQIV